MAERMPPEPSPAARELLRAFREQQSPAEHVREHGWQALRVRLELAPPATSAASAAANGAFYAKVVGITVGIAAAVLLSLKLVGAGVVALSSQARQPAMEAPHHGGAEANDGTAVARASRAEPDLAPSTETSGPAGAAGAEVEAATSPLVASEPTPSSEAVGSPRSRSTRSTPAPDTATSLASADALRAEIAIIKRATKALEDGRHDDGLAALREHAERFPRGTMTDERAVLRAELLCAAGRTEESRAAVEAFLREHAGSALAGRMRHACTSAKKP
ncbi:hypothetical protein [Paraliomyxa miuraensis]|uniref:hypothetical protein n=1 Tax=Paraliomyxa miuraensis TaxID=376150 RepID=UPI002250FB5A|nr:hypothetical protein [Paraliomyxa miuraensis]MCX4246859.1 hypothetical protein [Paraliomyxa miuraensis]